MNIDKFIDKFKELFILTKLRKNTLKSIIEYSVLYLILVSSIGFFIDRLFPIYNERKRKIYIFLEVCIQIILSTIAIYYIREFIILLPLLFPFMIHSQSHYQHGDIIISIILLSVQQNLQNKINLFVRNSEPNIVKKAVKTVHDTTSKITTQVIKDTTSDSY
jgi:hypothetical protein